MEKKNKIELDKVYKSKKIEEQPIIEYDKNSKKKALLGKNKTRQKNNFYKNII